MRDLVLLPGWGMPAHALSPLLPRLRGRFHLTVASLPRGASLAGMAQAALAAAPPRAAWFGWSLGGMVAAQAALAAPARVGALVTLATSLSFVARSGWPQAMAADEFAAFRAQYAAAPGAAHRRFLSLQAQGSATAREDLRTLRDLAGDPRVPAAADALAALDVLGSADLRADAGALHCPSLWLYGAHDALVPAAVAGTVAAAVPGAQVHTLAGAAHAPFLHDPGQVADLLAAFLAEHP